MIEQKLTTYFKRYASITPRADFLTRSRAEATTRPQVARAQTSHWLLRMKESATTGSALALASFLLLIIVGGVSYISKQGGQIVATGSFNNAALEREATQISFQVQLKDAEYFDESASQVVRALDNIANESEIQ